MVLCEFVCVCWVKVKLRKSMFEDIHLGVFLIFSRRILSNSDGPPSTYSTDLDLVVDFRN